jgi:hypothetical protein
MAKIIKQGTKLQKKDDCGCGRPVKITDPKRKIKKY